MSIARISRRGMLARLGTLSAMSLMGHTTGRTLFAATETAKDASQVISGKNAAMQVIESKPLVLETPLSALARPGVTATDMLFVRNNQDLPGTATLEPVQDGHWGVEIRGLVNKTRRVTVGELKNLPQKTVEMILQCSGNSRYRFAETVAVKGTPWGDGGMGNVRFTGPSLVSVLESLGVEPAKMAKFVTAGGADQPEQYKGDFEHSVPLADVLERSLLAVSLNDAPLPAIHGGPVRLVTPGLFGTMQMKWLTSLEFAAEESTADSQAVRYRMPRRILTPGDEFKYDLTNSRSGWVMNVKSVILVDNGARLPVGQPYSLGGVAFNDGTCAIEAVLISTDRGQSWTPARLTHPDSKYSWTRWTYELPAKAGAVEVWSRAIDELGRTQPLDGRRIWNPGGYEFNAVDKRVLTFA